MHFCWKVVEEQTLVVNKVAERFSHFVCVCSFLAWYFLYLYYKTVQCRRSGVVSEFFFFGLICRIPMHDAKQSICLCLSSHAHCAYSFSNGAAAAMVVVMMMMITTSDVNFSRQTPSNALTLLQNILCHCIWRRRRPRRRRSEHTAAKKCSNHEIFVGEKKSILSSLWITKTAVRLWILLRISSNNHMFVQIECRHKHRHGHDPRLLTSIYSIHLGYSNIVYVYKIHSLFWFLCTNVF